MEVTQVVLLTLLRILLCLTIISFPIVFSLKNPKDQVLYIPYYLALAFELVMLFYHPLVGIITVGTAFLLIKYFINTSDNDKFTFRFERVALYLVLMVFSCSVLYEVVETIMGRLF